MNYPLAPIIQLDVEFAGTLGGGGEANVVMVAPPDRHTGPEARDRRRAGSYRRVNRDKAPRMPTVTPIMNIETELDVYLRARFTLLLLQTAEEERGLQLLKSVGETRGRPVLAWDIAESFQTVTAKGTAPVARDPITALEHIDKAE